MLVVLAVGIGASCHPPVPLELELVECIDPPPEAKLEDLNEVWMDWYLNDYDVGCHAICEALYGEGECDAV